MNGGTEHWEDIQRLFAGALERSGPERERYLEEACRGDAGLRREVEELLRADAAAGRGPAPTATASEWLYEAAENAPLPASIGPYRPVAVLGEGGMGVVYLADQEAPIQRRVALKLVKWGMDTREVLSRFRAEMQTLAQMSHPGIARVHDAGATADGRPYFVMEYIEGGVPINDYCDVHQLRLRPRLELFLELCAAVQYAHQKGVIHRDLKPSNVLLTESSGAPAPRIIDFGIAKAIEAHGRERSLQTETGQIIGTPGYMSPEQAAGAGVDTRTDVYSLGAILYELLVGTMPIDFDESRHRNVIGFLLALREEEPVTPSTRLTRLGAASIETAARRHTEPGVLRKALRGDLDWIAMKALEKEPARRYASVSDLAADVRRHLADEPVLARPPNLAATCVLASASTTSSRRRLRSVSSPLAPSSGKVKGRFCAGSRASLPTRSCVSPSGSAVVSAASSGATAATPTRAA